MLATTSFHGGPYSHFTHPTATRHHKPYFRLTKPHSLHSTPSICTFLSPRRLTGNRFTIRALNRDDVTGSEKEAKPFFPNLHTVKIPVGDRFGFEFCVEMKLW
ncbi:hypothetical protein Hanom_Chr07g00661431 [Helianthus anomalus]